MGCFSGRLRSSASDQKLFCRLSSPFCCSFDEFVEEKVISPSYSSAILTPPPNSSFLIPWHLGSDLASVLASDLDFWTALGIRPQLNWNGDLWVALYCFGSPFGSFGFRYTRPVPRLSLKQREETVLPIYSSSLRCTALMSVCIEVNNKWSANLILHNTRKWK